VTSETEDIKNSYLTYHMKATVALSWKKICTCI